MVSHDFLKNRGWEQRIALVKMLLLTQEVILVGFDVVALQQFQQISKIRILSQHQKVLFT
jgi:hypothetical protein